MSIHINAKPDEIADTVLLPGDPMRAKHIAETMLDNPVRYNDVRGMYGYTGKYNGKRVSIQGSGMGMPSIAIYANELIQFYNVKNLIRVGSCGAIQPELKIRDIILASSASTDSAMNKHIFKGADFAPTATFSLLYQAYNIAREKGIDVTVGSILSGDSFYSDDPEVWKTWARYGILAIEMEAAALYTIAAKFKVQALAIVTVSDILVTEEADSSETREKSYTQMFEIALNLA